MFKDTFWAIVPALIAIIIALISKEVYISLFIGIVVGAFLISDLNILNAFTKVFDLFSNGIGFNTSDLSSSSIYNFSIVLFLVLLGILVVLVNRSGGAKAYGKWSNKTFKSRKSVMGATIGLGAIISVDDYFNNLTVGSIMVPVTDSHKISRAKLSYLIDSIAAPICIICPISSWAVAVSGVVKSQGFPGFTTFLETIPYNLYALFTIFLLLLLTITGKDYGKMKEYERKALEGNDISIAKEASGEELSKIKQSEKGRVFDLVIPIVVLVVVSIFFMLYTGGLFTGSSTIMDAFGNCDSGVSLCVGATIAIICAMCLYLPRKVMTFKEFTSCFIDGFKSMVPAVMILILAWTLNCVCQELGINNYVNIIVTSSGINLAFIPALFFIFALGLGFATGTSWGTFSILIPLVVSITKTDYYLTIIAISAVLSGAVCGDHVSPISDTTILASSGSKCNHLVHVSTQMPYAFLVAFASFIGFIVAGFTKMIWLTILVTMLVIVLAFILIIKIGNKKEKKKNHE